MPLALQLGPGDIGWGLTTFGLAALLIGIIPFSVWLVISLILYVRKRKASLKWWGIIATISCAYALFTLGFTRIFSSVSYDIATRIRAPVPLSVRVLENTQQGWMDENQEYAVVQLNLQQMQKFIHRLPNWKHGTVSPYSLIRVPESDVGTDQDPMYDKKFPMPNAQKTGYYYSSISKRFPHPNEWYTTRKAYFLDVNSRILYVFYDDAQWG